jgi:SNF2 family DNA or RNA helicase
MNRSTGEGSQRGGGGVHPLFPQTTSAWPPKDTAAVLQEYCLGKLQVQIEAAGFGRIVKELRARRFDTWEWYQLARRADRLAAAQNQTQGLLALEHLRERWQETGVIPYEHQIRTAERVIHELHGQAILADEVGLGKTIEAGLILTEYMLRSLVKKVLILTPANLIWQWYYELYEKFGLAAGIQRTPWDWTYADVLIASLDTAKREPHASIVKSIVYDLLIIDEAHKLKNSSTASYRLVNSLQKKYCLMLTATPVQNDLKELYNLIGLIKPGQLGSYQSFKRRFMADKRTPKNPRELRQLLDQVMIRNRREEGTVRFTERIVHPIIVALGPREQEIYLRVSEFIKSRGRRAGPSSMLPLITLQREVCSSFLAVALTLEKMMASLAEAELAEAAALLKDLAEVKQNSKCDALERLVAQFSDKAIIFTEYRASQEYIRYRLERAGYHTLAFDGSLSRGQKQWVRHLFQREAQFLVSTESGGEGLNFQFCNLVVNFDLPWNPMRLEQRIGRVHRLGQMRDVHIYNLITKDTVEEHIMYLLHKKINMFESIIGELDAILLHLNLGKSFESEIMKIFLEHEEREQIQAQLDGLAEKILSSRDEIRAASWEG